LFILIPLTILIWFAYFLWYNSRGRQTPGKKFFGLLVVDEEDKIISLKRNLLRTILLQINITLLGLGYLLIGITQKKQSFHDLLAGTYVVRVSDSKEREPVFILTFILGLLLTQFLLGNLMRTYIASYRIPTTQMENTLLVGDYILVDKGGPYNYSPVPGDLVVFRYPWNPDLNRYPVDPNYKQINRCVAIEGQTVEIVDKLLYIDGIPFTESENLKHIDPNIMDRYNHSFPIFNPDLGSRDNFGPVTVPPNHYFMLGDNRDNSSDSRDFGFVPKENIVGKGGIVYLSFNRTNPYVLRKIRWDRIGKIIK
jgi:signal peptidase I